MLYQCTLINSGILCKGDYQTDLCILCNVCSCKKPLSFCVACWYKKKFETNSFNSAGAWGVLNLFMAVDL